MDEQTVLHVLPTISRNGGGVAEAARLLVLSLSMTCPNAVSVLTTRDEYSKADIQGWRGVSVTFVRAFPPKKFGFAPGMLLEILRRRPSVVHLHGLWTFHCAAALVWSCLTRGHIVITIHGMLEPWIVRRSPRLKWVFRLLFLNPLIARADCLHVLTEKERFDVTRLYPKVPTATIPNFVRAETSWRNDTPPIWWEPALDRRKVFVFLGRLHEKKGCSELLEAWERVSMADSVFRDTHELVFCGWSDGADAFLANLVEVRRRVGNVRYVGAQFGVQKRRTLAASRFFILPSKSEGLPMTVLEAWQAGALVIMTSQCNLSIGFIRGAALETGAAKERIAESLVRAAGMPEHERNAMTAAGRKIVEEFFSEDVVTTAILRLYENIKTGRGANGPSPPARQPRSD